MDENGTPTGQDGLGRRDMLKKAAVAGAVAVWATPAVQTIGSVAGAQTGSDCTGCIRRFFIDASSAQSTGGNETTVFAALGTSGPPECACTLGTPTVNFIAAGPNVNLGAQQPSPPPAGIWLRANAGQTTSATIDITANVLCGSRLLTASLLGVQITWPAPPGPGLVAGVVNNGGTLSGDLCV